MLADIYVLPLILIATAPIIAPKTEVTAPSNAPSIPLWRANISIIVKQINAVIVIAARSFF